MSSGTPETRMLTASDGVPISALHTPGLRDVCFVLVHGFTGNWKQDRVRKVITRLEPAGGVVAIDMRGHGGSGGQTTVGDREVLDAFAGIEWARELGYEHIVLIGFSLGGAVVLRAAALADEEHRVDAVVSVSAPAFWYYRGTRMMRLAHRAVETRSGRLAMRAARGTRISTQGWPDPPPIAPHEAAGMFGEVPLLVVHGDADRYFPIEHPKAIHESAVRAGVRTDLWIEPGFDHAESSVSTEIVDRITEWARSAVGLDGPAGTP